MNKKTTLAIFITAICLLAAIIILPISLKDSFASELQSVQPGYRQQNSLNQDCPDEFILRYAQTPDLTRDFCTSRVRVILRHRYSVGKNANKFCVKQNFKTYSQSFRTLSQSHSVLSQSHSALAQHESRATTELLSGWIEDNVIQQTELFNEERFNQIIDVHLPTRCRYAVLQKIEELQMSPKVLFAGPLFFTDVRSLGVPNDPEFYRQWGLHAIDMQGAWRFTTGNTSARVGIMEKYAIGGHQDFIDSQGYNRIVGGNNPSTNYSALNHATQVASVLGAVHNDIGIAGIAQVSMLSLNPLRINEHGQDVCGFAESLRFAALNGIRIINSSFAYGHVSPIGQWVSAHRCPYRIAAIRAFNGLIVTAAGNDERDNDRDRHYPSNYSRILSNVIAVGATTFDEELNIERKARFPDWGDIWPRPPRNTGSNIGEQTVQIFAPGTRIRMFFGSHGTMYDSGTSFSAPMVSGTAALMLSVNPALTGAQMRDLIVSSADIIEAPRWHWANPDTFRRLNAHRAVQAAIFHFREISGTNGVGVSSRAGVIPTNLEIPATVMIGGTMRHVTRIDSFAFIRDVTNITIPHSVTAIGNYAFLNATGLQSITVYNMTPPTFSFHSFSGVTRSNVTLRVPFGARQAFFNAGWNGFNIVEYPLIVPYGLIVYNYTVVAFIPPDNFCGHVDIPYGVIFIAGDAFRRSCATSISIPGSVSHIGRWAFAGSALLTYAYHSTPLNSVIYIDGWAVGVRGQLSSRYSFKHGTVGIAEYTIVRQSNLTSLVVPASVRYISNIATVANQNLETITILRYTSWCSPPALGMFAFNDNRNLKAIFVENYSSFRSHVNWWQVRNILKPRGTILPNTTHYLCGSMSFNMFLWGVGCNYTVHRISNDGNYFMRLYEANEFGETSLVIAGVGVIYARVVGHYSWLNVYAPHGNSFTLTTHATNVPIKHLHYVLITDAFSYAALNYFTNSVVVVWELECRGFSSFACLTDNEGLRALFSQFSFDAVIFNAQYKCASTLACVFWCIGSDGGVVFYVTMPDFVHTALQMPNWLGISNPIVYLAGCLYSHIKQVPLCCCSNITLIHNNDFMLGRRIAEEFLATAMGCDWAFPKFFVPYTGAFIASGIIYVMTGNGFCVCCGFKVVIMPHFTSFWSKASYISGHIGHSFYGRLVHYVFVDVINNWLLFETLSHIVYDICCCISHLSHINRIHVFNTCLDSLSHACCKHSFYYTITRTKFNLIIPTKPSSLLIGKILASSSCLYQHLHNFKLINHCCIILNWQAFSNNVHLIQVGITF